MTALTARHSLPYAEPGDGVKASRASIQTMTELVDTKLTKETGMGTATRWRNLANFEESGPSLTGYIIIQTNMDSTNYMTRFHITGYCYTPYNNLIDLQIGFYMFGDGNMHNYEAKNNGTMRFGDIQVLKRVSDGKIAIALLPDTRDNAGQWHYPKVFVDVITGHTAPSVAEMSGWTMTRQASLAAWTIKRAIASSRPYMRSILSTPLSAPSGSWYAIISWTQQYSHPNIVYSGTSQWNVTQPGLYQINATVMWQNQGYNGNRGVRLMLNGSELAGNYASGKTDDYASSTVAVTVPLTYNDGLQVHAIHGMGVTGNIHSGHWTSVSIIRVD